MSVSVANVLSAIDIVANDADPTDSEKRWPLAERLKWLNEGARILCVKFQDAKVSRISVTLVAGAKQTLPEEAITLLALQTSTGKTALPCDKNALDAYSPEWQQTPGSGVDNWMFDQNEYPTYWVSPPQSATPNSVVLTCQAYPSAVTSDSDTLDVQAKYEANLINYVLYRMFSKDAEVGSTERAVAHLQLFNA